MKEYPPHVKCIKLIKDDRISKLIKLGEIYPVNNGKIQTSNGKWICDYGSINGKSLFEPYEPHSSAKVLKNL